jgi:MFS family permease
MPLVAIVGAALGAGAFGTVAAVVLFGVIGVSWAVIAVTAGTIVTRLAPAQLRGEALGVYAALAALAGGVGSIAGGVLANALGFVTAFAAAGAVILAGAAVVGITRSISHRTFITNAPAPQEGPED